MIKIKELSLLAQRTIDWNLAGLVFNEFLWSNCFGKKVNGS